MARVFVPLLVLVLCACACAKPVQCETGAYPPEDQNVVPWGTVNLDDAPADRWTALVKPKAQQLKAMVNVLLELIPQFVEPKLLAFVNKHMPALADELPAPYGDEIKGIAQATGIPLGEIVTYNVFYELFTVCTSIVAEGQDGTIYHARNLDFGLFMGYNFTTFQWKLTTQLRPLLMNVDFQRNGTTVFKATQFLGYVGILTGMKPNAFTMTINDRFALDGGFVGITEWILGNRKQNWLAPLTRSVFEDPASTYQSAVQAFSDAPLIAPVYFIVGGMNHNEGAVVSRTREKTINTMTLNTTPGTPRTSMVARTHAASDDDKWYVLETNYDNWKKPFILDDRRTPGMQCMNETGRANVSFETLFNVLSTRPVRNQLTTYSVLMCLKTNEYESYLQYCDEPCAPW
mmetsp:Transcript_32027/g.80360  ORF Transcript_32027/g.80360 Transcript_32027/m.80360 type:complete len:403 (-) Transcript_32027:134-1342(-)|eukprot:CAMPEP_0177647242 /NCGR_PEP_ID=MMETSP0447-20121125/10197_1 /TAXON_ID=0 /ORGANISM="Stygamoeba regulata, Strain BSH-02190019" /LENGTH=402 /DNA_ID=CAMNT_0019149817 /DNA_START=93 /DNA_END=1301 /DNA_ORIENTATION=-